MGARGPRPELATLKRLKGNPGRRPLPPPGLRAEGVLIVPEHLSAGAKACFATVVASLPPGTYGASDGFTLGAFCTAWDLHRQACEQLAESTLIVEGRVNPLLYIINAQATLLASLGDRLGLNPKARDALGVAVAKKPASKFEGLLRT